MKINPLKPSRRLATSVFALLLLPTSVKAEDEQPKDEKKPDNSEQVTVEGKRITNATSEGNPSYAAGGTTIGLGEHTLRETPNSVSVITRQRIEDQNMLSLQDAMQYTTAMKVTSYGTNTTGIESRGYEIDHFEIDGVSASSRVYENNFPLAIYDRVEVVRGSSGLLQGAGEPSGTINFVRKRAQKNFSLGAKYIAGSWNNNYEELDVTDGLNADGSLRGRIVATYQDQRYFTDTARSAQPMVYGTLEYDLDPKTTLSIGSAWQRRITTPFFGLPAYATGGYPDISRNTFVGAQWNHEALEVNRNFIELEHDFSGGSKLALIVDQSDRKMNGEISWGNSFVDPATGNFDQVPYFSRDSSKENNVSLQVSTPFQWLGLNQEINWGAQYQKLSSSSAYNGSTWGQNGFVQNIFHPEIDVAKPDVIIDAPTHSAQIQEGVYGQLRLKPWEPLTILAGTRLAWFKSQDLDNRENDLSSDGQFIPYAGLVYDVAHDVSVYGSYSSIYAPQSDKRSNGQYLKPRVGDQYEVGLKGEHFNGRMTSSLAFYRILDKNRATTDVNDPNFAVAGGEVRSQGAEAELSGLITPHWNLTAGYGFNETKQIKAPTDQNGRPFTTIFPKNTFSLWTDYRFTHGALDGVNVGGGARYRSEIYNEDSGIRWGQSAFTVYSLQAGYEIAKGLKGSVTVDNLFDKKYIDRPENWSRQMYYGQPRSFLASLSFKFD